MVRSEEGALLLTVMECPLAENCLAFLAAPMSVPEVPHLKYNIAAFDGGVLLSIWEPAPKNDIRVKPFLYMARYRVTSEAEARKLLAQYIALYKSMFHATHSYRGPM